jgi:hypothetical protein
MCENVKDIFGRLSENQIAYFYLSPVDFDVVFLYLSKKFLSVDPIKDSLKWEDKEDRLQLAEYPEELAKMIRDRV